ncbi:MAG: mRNA surveillance protein pelota [Candidatus ainarchaeum sp.]|nr:mRNA surveillance protein pelota [Candidatus ainarchaeum sp.]
MKILSIDRKLKLLKVIPENADDLWHLEKVIEKGDLVSGSTDRKIKAKNVEQKAERVQLFVTIEIEKTDFQKFSGVLRAQGIVIEGKPEELVELKSHQTIEIELGKPVIIKKKELKNYQVERIEKAKKASQSENALLVVFDEENASFGLLKEFELEPRGIVRGASRGKRFAQDESVQKKYFEEIMRKCSEIKAASIVFAGPGFEKESLKKWLEEKGIKGNFLFANVNSTGITGLQELMKHDVLEKISKQRQIIAEAKLVEEVLAAIGKNTGFAEYGFEQVKKAVELGAAKELLVLDSLLLENREKTEPLMDAVEKNRGIVHIINAEQEPGEKLKGLGGIAAILKFKLQY